MKSLTALWRKLADENASWCCTSITHDFNTVVRRVEKEGLSFFTITLPAFAKEFDKSLDKGRVDDCSFTGFRRRSGLPLFLGGFLHQIFDTDGVLLEEPNVEAIRAIRQLTMAFGKIELPCSDAREAAARRTFLEIEEDLAARPYGTCSDEDLQDFVRVGSLLFANVLSRLDELVWKGEKLLGRHGPGATADRIRGNQKWLLPTWHQRLEDGGLTFGEYASVNSRWVQEGYGNVQILEPEDEPPVRVVSVPKTQKTPRIIAIEPTCMMFMQQAVSDELVKLLESPSWAISTCGPSVGHESVNHTVMNPAYGFLGFADQDPNRLMAKMGSLDGGALASLDLSEASDRVSNRHVELLMARWPWFSAAVQACRSQRADLDGTVIGLTKFASMGSALCFPIEAMVFTTIVFMGIERARGAHLTLADLKDLRGKVRVYGDDIICPIDSVHHVIRTLETFGLKVNTSKSFFEGNFRESCGGDFYRGEWVTPVRVRDSWPESRADVHEVISLLSLRNQLYHAGYWRTVRWLDRQLGRFISPFPTVRPTSPALGRHTFLDPFEGDEWVLSRHTHSPVVRARVVSAKPPKSNLGGHAALLKCLSGPIPTRPAYDMYYRRWSERFSIDVSRSLDPRSLDWMFPPNRDVRHLERQGRPRTVSTKSAKVSLD